MKGKRRPTTAVIGAGRLARTLVPLLVSSGYPLLAVASRTITRARELSRMAHGARATTDTASVLHDVELVLLATPDHEIASVASSLASAAGDAVDGMTFLHHAGALGPDVLEPLSRLGAHAGVLHPLQALSGTTPGILRGSRARIEGNPTAVRIAMTIAEDTGLVPLRIRGEMDRSARVSYHAAASMVANDLLALLALGIDGMEAAGIERHDALEALVKLARGSLSNVETAGELEKALTGPVVRGDAVVLEDQINSLAARSEHAAEVHRLLSIRLLELVSESPDSGGDGIERLKEILFRTAGRPTDTGV